MVVSKCPLLLLVAARNLIHKCPDPLQRQVARRLDHQLRNTSKFHLLNNQVQLKSLQVTLPQHTNNNHQYQKHKTTFSIHKSNSLVQMSLMIFMIGMKRKISSSRQMLRFLLKSNKLLKRRKSQPRGITFYRNPMTTLMTGMMMYRKSSLQKGRRSNK